MHDTGSLIQRLPKCELHIHIEGSLEPELMFTLARRNGIRLPYNSVEAVRRAYSFGNLQDFLDIYYQGMSVLIAEQDFYDLALAYLRRAHADNVRHVEMFFDPQGHTGRGIAFSTVVGGLHRAIVDAERELGVKASLIMCFLRHLDEADAEKTLDSALAFRDKIVGVGLNSSETGNPPSKFQQCLPPGARCRLLSDGACRRGRTAQAMSGKRSTCSASPASITAIVRWTIRALVGRLARERIALTVCPLSNLRLRVIDDLKHHPLRRMMDKGLVVTVNSDDPAYFGGYVNENYRAVSDGIDAGPRRSRGDRPQRHPGFADDAAEKNNTLTEIDRVLAESA